MKPTTKVCKKCNTEKSLEAFHKSKTSHLGVNPTCKVCRDLKPNKQKTLDNYTTTPRTAEARYAAKNKHKRKAKDMVRQAIKDGRLLKPFICEHCSTIGKVEGHHSDYNKPLEVIWLCCKCHNLEHVRLNNLTPSIN